MRRRQIYAMRNKSALDPSGAASGPGAESPSPPPVLSRAEEEATAQIWTPTVDETAAVQVKKKRGRPKGSKNKVRA